MELAKSLLSRMVLQCRKENVFVYKNIPVVLYRNTLAPIVILIKAMTFWKGTICISFCDCFGLFRWVEPELVKVMALLPAIREKKNVFEMESWISHLYSPVPGAGNYSGIVYSLKIMHPSIYHDQRCNLDCLKSFKWKDALNVIQIRCVLWPSLYVPIFVPLD